MDLAPIVLFVYNRPWHTRQCLESLEKNDLANQSILFIYADGPKENATDEQLQKIKEVRKLIREKKWCKEVYIIESEKNKGLANSVIDGVTEIVNKYGKIIVLEDDLVLAKGFLKYMNEGLAFYKEANEVISVHGYVYPVKQKLPETFFLKGADCWGWATWKRGWDLFERDGMKLYEEIHDNSFENDFDYNGSYPFTEMLKLQIEKKIDSWAIKWYASAFLNNKLTLYPGVSFIQNIGNDGSGMHSGKTNKFEITKLNTRRDFRFPDKIEENMQVREMIIDYFKKISKLSQRPNIINHIFSSIKSLVPNKYVIWKQIVWLKSKTFPYNHCQHSRLISKS